MIPAAESELHANSFNIQLLGGAPSHTPTGLWGALAASSAPSRHHQFGLFLKTYLQDSNFLHIEASDSSKTITVVDGSLSLPRSSLAKPIRPLLEDHENLELQVEVSSPSATITTPVGIFSLPAELLCHILLLLPFRDLSYCALACKTFWHVAQNCADIQCLFELHAQGFTETPTLDWVDVSSKMYSFKRLASIWRSDFHLNPVFEEIVAVNDSDSLDMQSVKCGVWWMYAGHRLFIRGCDTNTKPPQTRVSISIYNK